MIMNIKILITFLLTFTVSVFAQTNVQDAATITVTGEKRTSIEKSGTTTTVTAQDIDEKSSKLLKDTLTQVPGMQVETQRKGTRSFTMRGYSMSKVAMLIDGIPVIDSFGGGTDIDNIGLLDVSDIIISRGTSSALYGARGTVGSINIIKTPPKKSYLKLAAEADHLYNHMLSFAHGAPIGNFYYLVSGSYDKSDGYEISKKLDQKKREKWLLKLSRCESLYGIHLSNFYSTDPAKRADSAAPYYLTDTGKWDHINHEKYKVNGKVGYHFTPNLEIGATAFYNKTEMQNSIYNTDLYSVYRYNDFAGGRVWSAPVNFASYSLRNSSSCWPDYDDYAVSPFLNFKNGGFELKLNAYYYNQYNKYASYTDPKEGMLSTVDNLADETWSIWENQTYGFNIYPSVKLSENNKLSFAVSYYIGSHSEYDQAFNNDAVNIIHYYGKGKYKTEEISAAYLTLAVEDEIRIGKKTELSMGVSYDAQDLFKYKKKKGISGSTEMLDETKVDDNSMLWGTQDSFNPVVGIVSQVTEMLQLRSSASYKTSFPTLQAYTSTESSQLSETKDDSKYEKLKPEKSINGNIGAELSFFYGKLTLGCDYFFSVYYDRLVRFYETKQDDYVYRNMDSSYVQGTETTFNWEIWDIKDVADISFGFTHTYLYARNLTKMKLSTINKGRYFEKLPEHKFTIDMKVYFTKTYTSLFIFGYYEYNQIQYTMKYRPESNPATEGVFTTDCFKPVMLNDPLMIDAKISQKIFTGYGDFEIYLLCKNIFDDYLADPFNPGPGRTWYAGLKAEW